MVVSLLAILIGYLLVGYRRMDFSHFQTGLPLQPFKIITTTGMVFISYGGITKIAAAVEEIKDPKKILVPGILSAFLVVYVIYLLVVFVTIGAMDSQTLAASYSPLTDAAGTFFTNPVAGAVSVVVITAAGLLAFFTTTNAGILSASRVPLAIPHIVVEGESLFDLVLVRNRYGIKWTNSEVVYTAFGLIGSRDERNFHLRALMSIAQMLQDPHFNTAWHRAKNEKELKTAIILSQRKRHI
jgi:amino acid permease